MTDDRPLPGDAVYVLAGPGQRILCWVWRSWPTRSDRFQRVEGGFRVHPIRNLDDLIAYRAALTHPPRRLWQRPPLPRGVRRALTTRTARRKWERRQALKIPARDIPQWALSDEWKTWERTGLRGSRLETVVRLLTT